MLNASWCCALEQVDIQVMHHQQISSTYNGLSSGVPLENVGGESSSQPNTSDQHVMPYGDIFFFGAIYILPSLITSQK